MVTPSSRPFATYFEDFFIPAALTDVQQGTIYEYRKAVRKFVSWSGCNIQIHEVTEGILDRFVRNMILEGLSCKTANAYHVYLRRIARHRYPDHFLKRSGSRPHEAKPVTLNGLSDEQLDVEGSIYRFYVSEYVPRKMIGAKQTSIDQLKYSIVRFGKFLGRAPLMTDLTDETLSLYMNWILTVANLSAVTANRSRSHLLALWRFAHRRKILTELPDVEKVRECRNLPEAWTMDQFSQIIEVARKLRRRRTGLIYPEETFFPAFLLTAYNTGLRLSSLLNIKVSDWNPERAEIRADASIMKHRVTQVFRVNDQCREAVESMLASSRSLDDQPEFLFPWPCRSEALHETYRKILKSAGMYTSPKDSFHKLRRTAATHLTASIGLEAASRQLGHSSVEMTRRYVDPRLTNQHRAADFLPCPVVRPWSKVDAEQ